MKKTCICLALLFSPFLLKAQNKVAYAYDNAGNRIGREIVMQAQKAKASRQLPGTARLSLTDMLNEHDIKIYPNPTYGFLKLSIYGLKGTDKCSMSLYTTKGAQIMANDVNKESLEINISNQPAGVYLLRITINNNSTIWKIIKK